MKSIIASVFVCFIVSCSKTPPNPTFVNLPSVTIGTQVWTTKNLDVPKYRNGDPIPHVTDSAQWSNLTTGAWCWYNNDSASYGATYGRLYNWYAVNDPRGLAPQGWHVPSNSEWDKMTLFLDPTADTTLPGPYVGTTIGTQLKSTSGWYNSGHGSNSSGFVGLPGGFRVYDGTFGAIGYGGAWWCSTEYSTSNAWYRALSYDYADMVRYGNYKTGGLSVRIVRD